ncbi:MAG: PQQ-dependent sugar dehydrogenase, partial [Ardenticatenaceae bacterium]
MIRILWLPVADRRGTDPVLPPDVEIEVFLAGVQFPVALAFAPDGRLFYAERFAEVSNPGMTHIRVVSRAGVLQETPFAALLVGGASPWSEKGLLGMTLDPAFAQNGYVYAYRTAAPDAGNPAVHGELLRFTSSLGGPDWVAGDMIVLVDNLPVSEGCCLNGGMLHFGPDGKLYLSVGDLNDAQSAQELDKLAGKLLRFNPDGTIPPDNPFVAHSGAHPAIYATGLRNVFGYAWDPASGAIYVTDNGPDCDDELDRIVAGGNYGWPLSYLGGQCTDPGPGYEAPLLRIDPPVGITGAAFYTGDAIASFQHDLFLASWNDGTLYQVTLNPGGGEPAITPLLSDCTAPPLAPRDLNMLSIATGPDGNLYFSCQERYGPRPPKPGTGVIFR